MIYDHTLIDRIYQHSPPLLQNLWVTAYGAVQRWERRTPSFRRYAEELERTQWWSAASLEALQNERLKVLIRHAYENVQYYRTLFDSLRLTPSDIKTAGDLYKLPVLTKSVVRQHWKELHACNVPASRATTGRTGGSTGIPLKFLLDKERVIFDHALSYRHWSWAGFQPGGRMLLLRGFTLVPPGERSGIYWRRDWLDGRIYLSGFHLSLANLPVYVSKLAEWAPRFLSAYPSSAFTLARYMEAMNVQFPLEAVFTSSEILTPAERAVIGKQFGCKVWDRYGTGERLAVTQQCEHGNYHQNAEYGILQMDSPRGVPAPKGSSGELIHTGLTNFSMPLIRYASEDVGQPAPQACPCGRGLPLAGAVEGRKNDVIVTADGKLMPGAGLSLIHEYAENVERCQLVQDRPGDVTLRVLPRPAFNQSDVEELVSQLRRRLGESTTIRLEIVRELALTPSGKERFIVSRVNLDRFTGLPLELPRQS